MFTVEFESDASVITTLDQQDRFNDVEVIIGGDGDIYMRQFDDRLEEYQVLYMSYQQLMDIMAAINCSEGAYYV